VATARAHAATAGLNIDYRVGVGEALLLQNASFEIVYCCDVLEHVNSVDAVIGEIARVLQPGGVFMYDTINRTLASKLSVVKVPQDWLKLVPPAFHVWDLFITPAELRTILAQHGLEHRDTTGLRPGGNPLATLCSDGASSNLESAPGPLNWLQCADRVGSSSVCIAVSSVSWIYVNSGEVCSHACAS
jgi:2-polyprenyl-6-hydroxyphenyl methylase/3-demethylubiquinone-9 3-methyltransferase